MSVNTPTTELSNAVIHREDDSSFEFNPENAKPIYFLLAAHQVTEENWDLSEVVGWLQLWSKRFIQAFDLEVSEISLCIEWLSARRYGHFRRGINGFGLAGEIAINRRYLDQREPWEILGTLLHELLHAWQETHGKPGKHNYHNKQFREKAREFGLIIDTRGRTQYAPDSAFFKLLAEYDIAFPAVPPLQFVIPGDSKLRKWSCQCDPPINVRVAVAHFHARCLWCGELFQQPD